MTRRRGRPSRTYRIRVQTERRDPIDYAALARAALEQAAMDQHRDGDAATRSTAEPPTSAVRERNRHPSGAHAAPDDGEGAWS